MTFTVTCITGPATGVITVGLVALGSPITRVLTDANGNAFVTASIPAAAGSTGTFLLPDAAVAATTGTANAFPVSASNGIVVRNGTLYAVDNAAGEGMSRCLNPTANVLAVAPLQPYFERINNFTGGSFTAAVGQALGLAAWPGIQATAGSTSLWAIDNSAAATSGPVLWRYDDTLVAGPALTSPANAGNVPDETKAALAFAALAAAQQYDVQYDVSATFAVNPLTVTPVINSSVITALTAGTQYFWRVRVTAQLPCRSNWSPAFSFTTALGVGPWTPGATPEGAAPAPGAQGVNLRPAFQWNPSGTSTTGYEFALDDNSDFGSPIVSVTVTNPVYDDLATDLAYGTTFYWKVRAVSATGASNWYYASFTTLKAGTFICPLDGLTFNSEAELAAHNAAAHAPTTPLYIWIVIAIGAVLVIAVVWLIFTTRRT